MIVNIEDDRRYNNEAENDEIQLEVIIYFLHRTEATFTDQIRQFSKEQRFQIIHTLFTYSVTQKITRAQECFKCIPKSLNAVFSHVKK